MTNPINCQNQYCKPYPNQYSGVTINVTNPMMNAYPNAVSAPQSQACYCPTCRPDLYVNHNYPTSVVSEPAVNQYPQQSQVVQSMPPVQYVQPVNAGEYVLNSQSYPNQQVVHSQPAQQQQAYPQQYYLNNYNILPGGVNNNGENNGVITTLSNPYVQPEVNSSSQPVPVDSQSVQQAVSQQYSQPEVIKTYNKPEVGALNPASVPYYSNDALEEPVDMSVSQNIINELDTRAAIEKEKEANKEKMEVVALTNEYIKSLENYLNNPNKDIRLMAAKEVLTRLNEDRDRYDDAALNALLNKMMQDPDKLVRVAAMSAFSSGLACGNEFTVKLLQNMQKDSKTSEDDALEAANILLKMSETKETKYVNVQPAEVQE